MEENIVNVNEFKVQAKLNHGVCPLNWLAEFYKKYQGKLVMLDNNLMSYLLNESSCDEIKTSKFDGYSQSFEIKWKATDEYPETLVVVTSYGREKIKNKDGQYLVKSNNNYFVIERLHADDILVDGMKYAENMKNDQQIVYLTGEEPIIHEIDM